MGKKKMTDKEVRQRQKSGFHLYVVQIFTGFPENQQKMQINAPSTMIMLILGVGRIEINSWWRFQMLQSGAIKLLQNTRT